MASVASVPYNVSSSGMDYEQQSCGGCHNPVDDGDGVVVAFGNSLWHVDCFKCAKCGNRVSADTNLLLLSDGSPVCASCSYNCAVCKKPISHEAIMTGDESYHAACFTCKTCGRHIGELVFAKTTQGIYCMACHNERVARSRRHAEQRRNKNRARDTTQDKDKENKLREKPSISHIRTNGANIPETPPTTPGLSSPQFASADSAVSHSAKRISTQSATLQNSRHHSGHTSRQPLPVIDSSTPPRSPSPAISPSITTTHASPPPSTSIRSQNRPSTSTGRGETLPLLKTPEQQPGSRRRSFDDGVLPTNGLLSPDLVASTHAEKRSSINSALRTDWAALKPMLDSQHLQDTVNAASASSDGSGKLQEQRGSGSRSPSPHIHHPHSSTSPKSHHSQSPTADTFYSPPTSPSYLNTSQPRSQTEQLLSQDKGSQTTKKHSLSDTSPTWNHQGSTPNQASSSGRASPAAPHTPNGRVDSPANQPHSPLNDHRRAGTPLRDLPSLPQEVGTSEDDEDADDELAYNDHTGPLARRDREHKRVSLPLALPPMSFSDSDTSFHDLLKLGRNSDVPSEVGSSDTPEEISVAPSVSIPIVSVAPKQDEVKEGDISKVSMTPSPTASSFPSKGLLPPTVLSDLPARKTSLGHSMSNRKPVPKAILLPETFQADMTLDHDDSSNGHSSPKNALRRSDSVSKAQVAPERRRPGSAGVASTPPPPLTPRSHARRASATGTLTSSDANSTTTTPTRSVSNPIMTVTDSSSHRTARPVPGSKYDTTELVAKRLKEALSDAHESGATNVRLDKEFLELIYHAVQSSKEKLNDMTGKFDGMKRASQQFIDGISVAQDEYDNELAARREAEAEVTRLKIQLSGQAARLTELSAGERKRDAVAQMSRDMGESLRGLERDLSKLKAERDLTAAEIEELVAARSSSGQGDGIVQRSLTQRFETLKAQYRRDLEPLIQQREALLREINELKEERNICLEETTALNARNEELVELITQTSRQVDSGALRSIGRSWSPMPSNPHNHYGLPATPKSTPLPPVPHGHSYPLSTSSITTSSTLQEEKDEPRATPNDKKKWFKPSKEAIGRLAADGQGQMDKEVLRHNFQQLTILRFARCDHCGDKMWGTQLRCNVCNIGCHTRCVNQVTLTCVSEPRSRDEVVNIIPLQPSMFGRDLTEQVRADSAKEHRDVPIIVEKCIMAVELLGMDYEGIYRKTGGSSQSKAITQLFERGNYDAFDLSNADSFNDISSITSVLKTYFRQLPNPLLTHVLHDAFVSAAVTRDLRSKADSLSSLVYQLPSEHFHTLRFLMLHLHRVQLRAAENLMNARNLGVVFGPTLMRSSDPNKEFGDMAGKALTVEWLIENAPVVFREQDDS